MSLVKSPYLDPFATSLLFNTILFKHSHSCQGVWEEAVAEFMKSLGCERFFEMLPLKIF